MYNLAKNKNIQKKLSNEIEIVLKNKDAVEYDDLKQMKYLDMVINETLRLYPVI
jgi:cytochrome P450